MAVISDYTSVPILAEGASIALGNFDGVHAGHRAVIQSAADVSAEKGYPLGVLIFEPPPRQFFQPDGTPFRIMLPEQRRRALYALGVDLVFELPFNAEMSQMSPRTFVQSVLVEGMKIRHLSVGFDFRFGRGREGDVDSLARFAEEFGFSLTVQPAVSDGADKVSSSAIRDALSKGRPERATHLLGRHWSVKGVVEEGEKRGRTIAFPTANLRLGDFLHPLEGVYAVWARTGDDKDWMAGVANFGRTPTTGERAPLLEVHLFDFDQDIYGQTLEVAFVDFLRTEKKFESFEALTLQIAADAAAAKETLKRMSNGALRMKEDALVV